jgi:hypothetical protein
MRAGSLGLVILGLAACLSGCGDKADDAAAAAIGVAPGQPANLPVDQSWINAAQIASDAIGGCAMPQNPTHVSHVVTLEKNKIVLLACSQSPYSYTDRLFVVSGDHLRLLSLPDYDAAGWFASDQAGMAELDAGAAVLTTNRKVAGKENCGSEGRYQWDGVRFNLQELRWQACDDKDAGPPPFPVIWPQVVTPGADLSDSAPAP